MSAIKGAALVLALLSSRGSSQPALWISENWGILRIESTNGAVVFEVLQANGGGSIYVEPRSGSIWTFSAATLYRYSSDGTLISSVLTPFDPTDPVNGFAVDESAGNVWLGLRRALHRLDLTGAVVGSRTLATRIRGMVVDRTTSRAWVAEQHEIGVYAPTTVAGDPVSLVQTIDRGAEIVKELEYDDGMTEIWVATDAHVLRYTPEFSLTFDSADALAAKREFLAVDGLGGVWGANNLRVAHMNALGEEDFVFRPFDDQSDEIIVGLDSDPAGNTLWVANSTLIRQYDPAGQLLQEFMPDVGDGVIRTLRQLRLGAELAGGPILTFLEPLNGALLGDSTPTIVLEALDGGGGVDIDSLEITTDGDVLNPGCTFTLPEISCVPAAPFADGVVALAATIANDSGVTSDPVVVEFTIDTVPPLITVASPPDGGFTNDSAKPIVGSVSETATLTIDGQSVPLDPENLFSYPTALQEGANNFALSATDQAGNSRVLTLLVNLDTIVPAPADVAFIEVGAPIGGFVAVNGQAASVEAGAAVLVTNLRTGESVTVIAAVDGSFFAEIAAAVTDLLEIRVEDLAGNMSTAVSVGGLVEPPIVDPALFEKAAIDGFIAIEIIPRVDACPALPTAQSIRTLDLIVNRLLSKSLILRNEIHVDSDGCVSLTVFPQGLEILAVDVRLAEIVEAE